VPDWQVQAALARLQVRLAPRPQRLAAQRRRYTEERIATRVAQLGFADVEACLVDWVVKQAWPMAEVAGELGANRLTVRRLLERHGIRRVRRTPAKRAAAESGRRVQAVEWRARRAAVGEARLCGPGRLPQGAVCRAGLVGEADAGRAWVGRGWLVGELARLGLRP
jgi:hypothetical protein